MRNCRATTQGLIALMLMLAMLLSAMPAAYAENDGIVIRLKVKNEQSESMYYGDEIPVFSVKLENNTTQDYDAQFICNVTDDKGKVVWTLEPEAFSFGAKSDIVKTIGSEIYEQGSYTFNISLTGSFGTYAAADTFSRPTENTALVSDIGVCTHLNNVGAVENADASAAVTTGGGFGWIRDDVRWNFVEPTTPGEYVWYDELKSTTDTFLPTGTKVLLILNHHNFLYRSDGGMVYEDEHIQAYANYCAYIAGLYKDNPNVAYELGNEPDNDDFSEWSALGGSAGEDYVTFAKLTKAGAEAIRRVDEDAVIIAGALCSLQDTKSRDFLSGMLSVEGVLDKVDGFSFHPYNYYSDSYCDEAQKSGVGLPEQIEYLRQKLTLAGKPNMPIWITEYGTPSYTAASWSYTEREQAVNLTRAAAIVKSEPLVENIMLYNLREKVGNQHESEVKFGIVDGDYEAKPAYVALSFMNSILSDTECSGSYISDSADNDKAFGGVEFKKENNGVTEKEVFMLWEHTGETAVLSVSSSASGEDSTLSGSGSVVSINIPEDKTVKYYDMLGNEIEAAAASELTEEPIYVVVKEDDISVTADGDVIVCEGRAGKPETAVTAIVRSKGELINEIIAVGQTTSDSEGNFRIELSASGVDGKYCLVHIFNGTEGVDNYIGTAKYRFDTRQYADGVECYEFTGLQNGNEITLEGKIYDLEKRDENINIFSADYGEDGTLSRAEVHSVKAWTDNEAEFELNIPTGKKTKLFVWDDGGKPVAGMSVID